MELIELERKVLRRNNELAETLRDARHQHGTFTFNLIGSPGAGKTTLLESLLGELAAQYRVGVIEGDAQTSLDAERLESFDIEVVQVVTQGACHLDAQMVQKAEATFESELDLLIIENVGNLLCPATFDVSEDAKVVVLSVTEGEEKPLKYPVVFERAEVVVLTKTDLLPHLDVDKEKFHRYIRQVNPEAEVFETDWKRPESFEPFQDWIQTGVAGLANRGGVSYL